MLLQTTVSYQEVEWLQCRYHPLSDHHSAKKHTSKTNTHTHTTHTHTRLTALCPGLPGWAGTRKVKPIWILLKQETVSGISWTICKYAPRSKQTTMPAPHCSVFYSPDALPADQPTASKHWRQGKLWTNKLKFCTSLSSTLLRGIARLLGEHH